MSSSAAQERIRTPHIEQKWRMVGIVGSDQPWIRKEERSLSFSICGVEWNDSYHLGFPPHTHSQPRLYKAITTRMPSETIVVVG